MLYAAWAPLTAFTATVITLAWLIRTRWSALALDHPNARSLHAAPIPRGGGIGIHFGIVLAWALIRPGLPLALWLAYGLLFAVSLLDDIRGVPVALRFAAYLLLAYLFASNFILGNYGMAITLVVALAMAWMINLYNFMDGADGLAGGMACFGFSFYGIAALVAHEPALALISFSVAAAAAAFLIFNFHPARIFMGDAGAVPLGFLAGGLGLLGFMQRDWTWWFPVLVFSPFIVDATLTLLRRLACGERVWEAHRDHYYQRLVQLGWGHRRTVIAEYGVMFLCGGAALSALRLSSSGQWTTLGIAAIIYLILMATIESAWRRFQRQRPL